jgi:hypothetical protein
MTTKDDGGPAFPLTADAIASENRDFHMQGMTLRDYFAAKALPIWVQAHIEQSIDDLSKPEIARECYSYADAMLEERKK